MSGYANFIAEDRRLVILRFLADDNDYRLNDSILQKALDQVGHNVSRDMVRSDLSWLEEQGLITVEVVLDQIHVAELTKRGLDVAEGRSKVPGVKRPEPRG